MPLRNLIYKILHMIYTMEAVGRRILSQKFIEQELTDEINKLLGLKYTRAILEALEKSEGLSFRSLEVRVIGEKGSASSASRTLKKMIVVGWIDNNSYMYCITKRGREALSYARQGDVLSPEETKGRVLNDN